jgi:hypothetical protein
LRQLVRLPWAAGSCPWVGKLRTVLPLNDRVIRDSAVPLWPSRGDELTVLYSNGPDDRSIKLALGYVTAATSGC